MTIFTDIMEKSIIEHMCIHVDDVTLHTYIGTVIFAICYSGASLRINIHNACNSIASVLDLLSNDIVLYYLSSYFEYYHFSCLSRNFMRGKQHWTYDDDNEKEKWRKITKMELMSSEESGEDAGEEVIITKPLWWLSPDVSHFFRKLGEVALKGKSPQGDR